MNQGLFFTHCRVLGLDSVSSEEELKRAYRTQISKWHPDRHRTDSAAHDAAVERAKEINAAYEYLSELLEAGYVPPTRSAAANASTRWREYTDTYRTRRTYQKQQYSSGFPDSTVTEVFVKSSNLVSVGHNAVRSILYVKFVGGGVYLYRGVPSEVYDALLAASSHGKFLSAQIKGQYPYERC